MVWSAALPSLTPTASSASQGTLVSHKSVLYMTVSVKNRCRLTINHKLYNRSLGRRLIMSKCNIGNVLGISQ